MASRISLTLALALLATTPSVLARVGGQIPLSTHSMLRKGGNENALPDIDLKVVDLPTTLGMESIEVPSLSHRDEN